MKCATPTPPATEDLPKDGKRTMEDAKSRTNADADIKDDQPPPVPEAAAAPSPLLHFMARAMAVASAGSAEERATSSSPSPSTASIGGADVKSLPLSAPQSPLSSGSGSEAAAVAAAAIAGRLVRPEQQLQAMLAAAASYRQLSGRPSSEKHVPSSVNGRASSPLAQGSLTQTSTTSAAAGACSNPSSADSVGENTSPSGVVVDVGGKRVHNNNTASYMPGGGRLKFFKGELAGQDDDEGRERERGEQGVSSASSPAIFTADSLRRRLCCLLNQPLRLLLSSSWTCFSAI